eukprot:COSAG01_NODE_43151_length_432_cov_6.780781_1_plen_93_part_01
MHRSMLDAAHEWLQICHERGYWTPAPPAPQDLEHYLEMCSGDCVLRRLLLSQRSRRSKLYLPIVGTWADGGIFCTLRIALMIVTERAAARHKD